MAFPTGYTKYQNITIDHTKVPGDLTDFIVYVNLANLVKAGADIFDLCRSDGGDLRATKSDGTTELPIEIVAIDTTAKTGEVHIKYTGTLSSSTDTVIRLYYNGTDTLPSVSSTYGRNNVWSAYVAVWHMQETSGNITSSTGTNTGTDNNTVGTIAGKIGNGRDFVRASSEYFSIATGSQTGLGITGNAITMSAWVMGDSAITGNIGRIMWRLGGTGSYGYQLSTSGASYSPNNAYVASFVGTGGGTDFEFGTAGDANNGVLKHIVATYDGTNARGYVNTSKSTSGSISNRLTNANSEIFTIGRDSSASYYDGILDEIRVKATVNSDNWITTEYNNQSSPATFYATSDEQGGATNITVTPAAQVATFTVPAYTVRKGITKSPAVQVATFSVPTYVVSRPKTVAVAAQVATFTVPAYTIDAGGNVTLAVSVQVLTASIPTYTVVLDRIVSVNTQVATLTIPAYTITAQRSITIQVLTQLLTFTIPTLAKFGGVWTKRARQTNATWSRRSVNDD